MHGVDALHTLVGARARHWILTTTLDELPPRDWTKSNWKLGRQGLAREVEYEFVLRKGWEAMGYFARQRPTGLVVRFPMRFWDSTFDPLDILELLI